MRIALALAILLTAWGQDTASLEHGLAKGTPDPGLVTYFLARSYTLAGRTETALKWIRSLVELNQGFDPSESPTLSRLSSSREFQALVRKAKSQNPAIVRSRTAFSVQQKALVTEGLAYDPESHNFYLGDIPGRKILRIAPDGSVRNFISSAQYGFGGPVGMKVDLRTRTLWANSALGKQTGIYHFDLRTAKLIKRYTLDGDHMFNDLALTPAGDVYLTDTDQGAVYRITRESDRLEQYLPEVRFRYANGIAAWKDRLFVSAFPYGVWLVDLGRNTARAIERPPGITLCGIDGLYVHGRSLIAIQNAGMAPRVARFILDDKMARIEKMEILERRHPAYDVPTTGTIAGDDFYYIANSQVGHLEGDHLVSPSTLQPVLILKLHL